MKNPIRYILCYVIIFHLAGIANNLTDKGFPAIRWKQAAEYGFVPNSLMPNMFMAVAIDLIDNSFPYGSIHPR